MQQVVRSYPCRRPLNFIILTFQPDCGPSHFRCKQVHQCIPRTKVCDLRPDCVDRSDEQDCTCWNFVATTDNKVRVNVVNIFSRHSRFLFPLTAHTLTH